MDLCILDNSDDDCTISVQPHPVADLKLTSINEILKSTKEVFKKFCTEFGTVNVKGVIKFTNGKNNFFLSEGANKIICDLFASKFTRDIFHENKEYVITGKLEFSEFHGKPILLPSKYVMQEKISDLDTLIKLCKEQRLFDDKKPVNFRTINKITIISKEDTHGYTDFINQLKVPYLINTINIQLEGPQTKSQLIAAIKKSQESDLIIIVRGGGDTNDISSAYDHIEIFQAIRQSAVPVGTCIGHIKDVGEKLLITLVSDINFHTPSTGAIEINRRCSEIIENQYTTCLVKYLNLLTEFEEQFDTMFEEYYNDQAEALSISLEYQKRSIKDELLNDSLGIFSFDDETKAQTVKLTIEINDEFYDCEYVLSHKTKSSITSDLLEKIDEIDPSPRHQAFAPDFEFLETAKINTIALESLRTTFDKLKNLHDMADQYTFLKPYCYKRVPLLSQTTMTNLFKHKKHLLHLKNQLSLILNVGFDPIILSNEDFIALIKIDTVDEINGYDHLVKLRQVIQLLR